MGSLEFVEFTYPRRVFLTLDDFLSERVFQSSLFVGDGAKLIWTYHFSSGQVIARSVELSASLAKIFSALLRSARRGLSAGDIHAIDHSSLYSSERHGAAVSSQISRLRRALAPADLVVCRRQGVFQVESPEKRVLLFTGEIADVRTACRKPRASPNMDKIIALFSESNSFLTTSEIIAATGISRQNVHRTLRRSVETGLLQAVIQGRASGYVIAADLSPKR